MKKHRGAAAAARREKRRKDGPAAAGVVRKRRQVADEDMFSSYARLEIHEAMLKDVPRTDAYRRAILAGKEAHFAGKVVLDVGCGVGILSLFAARLGGAKRVYAVEACAETAARARRVVAANGLSRTVKVICGTIEEVKLPSKVDTIISEWMGYFMVHESMLDSVFVARDRWLKEGGAMYPSRAQLFAVPGDFREQVEKKTGYWSTDVYGFDLSVLRSEAEAKLRAASPLSDYCQPGQLLQRKAHVVADWDLTTRPRKDVRSVEASFVSVAKKAGVFNGFAIWFDVSFPTEPAIVLSTGPGDPPTHWGQTIALVDHHLDVKRGQAIDWTLRIAECSANHRFYDLRFEYGLA